MKSISTYQPHPEFEALRQKILTLGTDDPFFDKEGFVGGYLLQQNSYEFGAFILHLRSLYPGGLQRYAEIGTAAGGFLRALHELVGFRTAISIDDGLWRAVDFPANAQAIGVEKIHRFVGDSHSQECLQWLKQNIQQYGAPDFFFIDGDHSYEGVKKDIQLAAGLLPRGTLVGFHDIQCNRTPGVVKAYSELKKSGLVKVEAEFVCQEINRMGIALVRFV